MILRHLLSSILLPFTATAVVSCIVVSGPAPGPLHAGALVAGGGLGVGLTVWQRPSAERSDRGGEG